MNLRSCCCHCVSPAETRRRVCHLVSPFPLGRRNGYAPLCGLRAGHVPFHVVRRVPASRLHVSVCTPHPQVCSSLPMPPRAVASNWPEPRGAGHEADSVEFGVLAPRWQRAGLGSAASWPSVVVVVSRNQDGNVPHPRGSHQDLPFSPPRGQCPGNASWPVGEAG